MALFSFPPSHTFMPATSAVLLLMSHVLKAIYTLRPDRVYYKEDYRMWLLTKVKTAVATALSSI